MTHALTRIIVATDLSPRSDRAVERAFQVANLLSLPVEALLVLDDALPETLLSPLHSKAHSQLGALCARSANGVRYSINVQIGDPTEQLVNASEPAETTLLVMGPHRPRPFLDKLRETTMQRVVRRTGAAVLLVNEPVMGSYKKILSMIDFNDPSTAAMQLGASLSGNTSPITPVHAVHIPYSGALDTTGTIQLDLQNSLSDDAVSQDKIWRAGFGDLEPRLNATEICVSPPEGLVKDATADRSYDLITAGAHGPVGAGRSLLGSVADDLMRNPPCDVLISR
ncbi:MAG: universal stress protein [Aliishimia sp.]